MPFCYRCLLDWNEQIWVSHVQFEIPPVSSRGVTSGLPSGWNRHSAGHRIVPKSCHLDSSARLDPPVWHCHEMKAPVMKVSIHLLPGPKTWHLSPTTNGLAFFALLLVS